MYTVDDVVAVVVSYNPDSTIIRNVKELINQVDRVIIFDNGSKEKGIEIIEACSAMNGVEVFKNSENLGIAQCLNKGLCYANQRQYKILLTMDQDTVLCKNCVNEMLSVLNSNSKIKSVGPNRGNSKNTDGIHKVKGYLITSGNLVVCEAANDIGGYLNDLFIDKVDIEFSLALRKKGYIVAIANDAKMNHRVGEPEIGRFLLWQVKHQAHSPARSKFIARNMIIVLKLYFTSFPLFCIKMSIMSVVDLLKIVFIENNKKQKFAFIKEGFREGIKYNIYKSKRRKEN